MVDDFVWTPWTAALAWGELLTVWHTEHAPQAWDDQREDMDRLVSVLIGRLVQATGQKLGIPPAEHPRDLQHLRVSWIAAGLDTVTNFPLLIVRLRKVVGPRSPGEPGFDEDLILVSLLMTHGPDWTALIDLCRAVGWAHAYDEGVHIADATLAGRYHAAGGDFPRQQRDTLTPLLDQPWIGT